MQTAARIGKMFQIDPVMVLKSPTDEWVIRVAAAKVIESDEKKEAAKQKSGGSMSKPSRSPRRSRRR